MSEPPLLEVSALVKTYRLAGVGPFSRKSARPALAGVSFSMRRGGSFGIVGESGSGKSTLARIALALDRPDSGAVRLEGRSLFDLRRRELRALARAYANGLPGPLRFARSAPARREDRRRAAHGAGRSEQSRAPRARSSVARGGRPQGFGRLKHPHEFSGGQRQRIAIARALITRPKLVVADEPVSALDVSVQAQALNLMSDLQTEAGVTFLLISHDLAVVAHICETTAVMYRGRIVEIGGPGPFRAASAPLYARAHRRRPAPRPADARRAAAACERRRNADKGCAYVPRCPFARARCRDEEPTLDAAFDGERRVACCFPLDLGQRH